MMKKTFEGINLTCVFQNTINFGQTETNNEQDQQVLSGMLSRTNAGDILFQETLPRRRDVRNSKLYQNEFVSLVRRKDGRYYLLLKAFRPEDITDSATLAFHIYSEISDALNSVL